jgi:predicted nucleotidyltransferase
MRTMTTLLVAVHDFREELVAAAARRGLSNIRVFGSTARGDADGDSDVDLLVHPGPDTSVFELAGFMAEASEMLGLDVDVVSDRGTGPVMTRILAEAVAL